MQHRPLTVKRRAPEGYVALSQRPLHILAFLLPLVVLYEVGAAKYLGDAANGQGETIRAHSMLLAFFQDFGLAGRFLPGIALVAVLLVSHALHRDRWRINPLVIAGMALEAVVWTIPLIVVSILLVWTLFGSGDAPAAAAALPDLMLRSREARVTVAVGAGLYEELVFRMIGMAALHMVFVDLAKLKEGAGRLLSVLGAAAAFALYHDGAWQSGQMSLAALPYFVAGAYFGMVYLYRGFGIVVAVHALYDVVVLLDVLRTNA
jgi:membrane protease YdiL (CAAX protease family)